MNNIPPTPLLLNTVDSHHHHHSPSLIMMMQDDDDDDIASTSYHHHHDMPATTTTTTVLSHSSVQTITPPHSSSMWSKYIQCDVMMGSDNKYIQAGSGIDYNDEYNIRRCCILLTRAFTCMLCNNVLDDGIQTYTHCGHTICGKCSRRSSSSSSSPSDKMIKEEETYNYSCPVCACTTTSSYTNLPLLWVIITVCHDTYPLYQILEALRLHQSCHKHVTI